jgi:hypothetical protein
MADTSFSSKDKSGSGSASEPRSAPGMKDKAKEEATALAEGAKATASSAVEKTKGAASSAVQKIEDAASDIGHKAEEAVDTIGGGMKSLAGTIRDNGPEGGVLGATASGIANSLESGGTYLQDHNFHGMSEDLTALVRRYPLQSFLLGVGVGLLVGRASRS